MENQTGPQENLKLPFALRFGRRPTVDELRNDEAEWLFKVTQTTGHVTKSRTPRKGHKYDKS